MQPKINADLGSAGQACPGIRLLFLLFGSPELYNIGANICSVFAQFLGVWTKLMIRIMVQYILC